MLESLFFILLTPLIWIMKGPAIKALGKYAGEEIRGKSYKDLVQLTDRSIKVNDKCNGCGTCAVVCPACNIEIENSRPAFKHKCEVCFACDEWCPRQAIQHWSRSWKDGIKYHHPDVTIKDMMLKRDNHG